MRALITGAKGQLGQDLVAAFQGDVPIGGLRSDVRTGRLGARSACEVIATDIYDLDITNRAAVIQLIEDARPDVVVHAAAWTAVDACESDPDKAFAVNSLATRHIAEAARAVGAHLLYLSTDYVFDGTSDRPYVEWDPPCPLSVYGRSKLGGEQELTSTDTIVRTSWVCGYNGANMVKTILKIASAPGELRFVDDQKGSPTFTADLAGMIANLATDRRPGIFHVTNQGATTWFEFAREVLRSAGDDPGRVSPVATVDLQPPRPAPRPQNSVLDNAALRLSGLDLLPDWHDALGRLVGALGSTDVAKVS